MTFEDDCDRLNEALVAAESFFAVHCDRAATVTLGERGALQWRGDSLTFIPAHGLPVSIHDAPLGARAAAAGALERLYAASKAEEEGLPEFVREATKTAQAFIERRGK